MRRRVLVALSVVASLATPAAASATVSVQQGDHYGARIFPDNFFATADSAQTTGLRVNLRLGTDYPAVGGVVQATCDSTDYSICDSFAELNKLDGFDVQPRVTVPLTGAIELRSVNDGDFYIADASGQFAGGLRQLTFDPQTNTLAGISDKFLREGSNYEVVVTGGIRDASGAPITACAATCQAPFTTRTASAELVGIRKALDSGAAYSAAGITDRTLSFVQSNTPDVFLAASVKPTLASPLDGIVRNDQVKADPSAPGALHSAIVPSLIPPGLSSPGYYAFGSFMSPRYQYASASAHQDDPYGTAGGLTDGEIPPVPSGQTPQPLGADRIGVIAVTPNPALFPPPWPAAIYGPGFTRSKYDVFVTADYNASVGIATFATDPAGHGYGSHSTTAVTTADGKTTTFLSYGRGRDLDGDGAIGSGLNDGVGPTGHFQSGGPELPSRKPIDGLKSGLVQTVVDNMALGRSLASGLTVPGVGSNLVDASRIRYYGLSFGGIYGTMLMGTDPLFHRGLLNVPGGPITDIARLSSFRGDLATAIKRSRPNLLNGGPGADGFTEDLPLRDEPSRVITDRGAAALQELFGTTNWYERDGSPETFAPRIRLRPDPTWDPAKGNAPKEFAFQSAYGDGTVPNPTAGTLYRAGNLFDRVAYYRNDRTPTYASDPHGWLADPTLAGRTAGEQQLTAFLLTGQFVTTNPAWLETPVANPANFECLHYPDPQTGAPLKRQPFPMSGDCAPAP